MKLVSLKEASEYLGISVISLRRRIYAGSLPYTRSNADKTGKILLNLELVNQYLLNEALSHTNVNGGFLDPEPVINYDPSFSLDEKPLCMANAHKFFGTITPEDAKLGHFSPDTFALRPTNEPTSETLTHKTTKKP